MHAMLIPRPGFLSSCWFEALRAYSLDPHVRHIVCAEKAHYKANVRDAEETKEETTL